MKVYWNPISGFADLSSPGVYLIFCEVTGLHYVGSVEPGRHRNRCMGDRMKEHVYDLERGEHHCAALQADWDRYGPNAFTFKPLERTARDVLRRECVWIIKLNAEYNVSWPGLQTVIRRDEQGEIIPLNSYAYLNNRRRTMASRAEERRTPAAAARQSFNPMLVGVAGVGMFLLFEQLFGR